MSAQDISNIPQANTINVAEFREPYRKIIRLLPRIQKLANNTNPNVTIEMKQARMDLIKAVFDSHLDQMRLSLNAVSDTNEAYQDFPETP